MITMTRLGRYGQLGNQLFQYAMLRAVAIRRGFELRIPMNYEGEKMKDLVELEPFSIEAARLNKIDVTRHLKYHFNDKLFRYNPAVFEQPDGTDFEGWFQTERYFADVEPQIRKEFTFLSPLMQKFIKEKTGLLRRSAEGRPLVSLHVRRGDYLKHPEKFRSLDASYYQQALESLSIQDPFVVLFSDDVPWCRENLRYKHGTEGSGPSRSHWEDLAMMSQCDHHIIGASSFSWWGAWLNPSHDKRVVAPSPWFGPQMGLDESDIVPSRWLTVRC